MMHHIIYKTTNVVTSKYYIGMHSTDNLNDGYLGSGKRLKYSINKYGKENHKVEILHEVDTREALAELEKRIVTAELINDPLCLNLKEGGLGGWIEHSPETKKRISESCKGKPISELNRQRNTELFKGKPLSEEHKEKIRAGNKGKAQKKSAEALANIHKAKCRPIVLEGIEYESVSIAALSLGVCRNKIYKMLKEQNGN